MVVTGLAPVMPRATISLHINRDLEVVALDIVHTVAGDVGMVVVDIAVGHTAVADRVAAVGTAADHMVAVDKAAVRRVLLRLGMRLVCLVLRKCR